MLCWLKSFGPCASKAVVHIVHVRKYRYVCTYVGGMRSWHDARAGDEFCGQYVVVETK